MSHSPNAAALAINWQIYGSNGHETADLSRGVLERFTRRAPVDWTSNGLGNNHVKTIANPRAINFMSNPHFAQYFDSRHAVNENGKIVPKAFNVPVAADKIVINHYNIKSREEYHQKIRRGRADILANNYDMKVFESRDRNEVFDDGILHYRDERAKIFKPPDKSRAAERLLNALIKNLSPTLLPTTPPNFYAGKMETFLTCRAVAEYLKPKLADDAIAKFFEDAALKALLKTLSNGVNLAQVMLFLNELPKILNSSCSAVDELRAAALEMLDQLKSFMRLNVMWKDFVQLDYIRDILKLGG